MINDIISCTSSKNILIKQIRKEKDTINYYHDGELAIYFNHKKYKYLKENTFYIINHGFNKSLILRIALMELEAVDFENRKSTFLTTPDDYTFGVYRDSLRRSSTMNATISLSSESYKKITLKAIQVEIKYYGISIYRWFLKEGPPTVPVLTAFMHLQGDIINTEL
jgi:hypothetical protein